MRRILLAVVLISLVAVLAGCGGSSSVDHVDPTIPILGAWQPVSATQDGSPVLVSTAMNWPLAPSTAAAGTLVPWTRGILEFTNTNQLNLLGYMDLSDAGTVVGTWTWVPGVVTITLNGVTTAISYVISDNLLTATFSRDGNNYIVTWVRVVDLTSHDALLGDAAPVPPDTVRQRKWQASSITSTVPAGGTADTLTTYFGLTAGTNTAQLTLRADGTAAIKEMNGSTLVGAAKNGRWFTDNTGSGEFGLSLFTDSASPKPNTVFSNDTRGFYTHPAGGQLTTTFLDVETGRTVVIVWDDVTPG
jgi:hypothetical protein